MRVPVTAMAINVYRVGDLFVVAHKPPVLDNSRTNYFNDSPAEQRFKALGEFATSNDLQSDVCHLVGPLVPVAAYSHLQKYVPQLVFNSRTFQPVARAIEV